MALFQSLLIRAFLCYGGYWWRGSWGISAGTVIFKVLLLKLCTLNLNVQHMSNKWISEPFFVVRNHIYSTSQMQGVAYTHSTCTCTHLCEKHVDLQHYTCLCAETNLFCLQVLNSFAHRDKHQQDLHILHTSCETCTPLECLWKVYNVKVESIPFIIKKTVEYFHISHY